MLITHTHKSDRADVSLYTVFAATLFKQLIIKKIEGQSD